MSVPIYVKGVISTKSEYVFISPEYFTNQYNIWVVSSDVEFKFVQFWFVETSGVPLEDFRWSGHFRFFSPGLLLAVLLGALTGGRLPWSRAAIATSWVLLESNPVVMSTFFFSSACGRLVNGTIFSLVSSTAASSASILAVVVGWCDVIVWIWGLNSKICWRRSSISSLLFVNG